MKKIIGILLLISLVLSLVSCGGDYPPVQSTSDDLKTVFEINYEGEKYEIKYELYRALFISFKESVDKGDGSVWSGDKKDEYINAIDALILDYASDIYASFHLCKKIGIDVYSSDFEEKIKEYIKIGVEGGEIDGNLFIGYDGNYDEYLKSLEKIGVNYSVQTLLLRYSLAIDAINEYYIGNIDGNNLQSGATIGAIKYTESDVKDFYQSNQCVRVIYAFLSSDAYDESRALEIRNEIAKKTNDEAVQNYIIGHTTLGASDVKNGMLISEYSLDSRYYGEIVKGAFALSLFETSPVFKFSSYNENGYVVMYKTIKDDEFFSNNYNDIVYIYLNNEIGKMLNLTKTAIIEGASATDYLSSIERDSILVK